MERASWRIPLLLVIALDLVACSRNGSDDRPLSSGDEPPRSPAEYVGEPTLPGKAKEAVGLGPSLPDLKPIAQGPFPDGATEEQVCEALSDTDEKDLWVRFGHLVPLYEPSTVFVLAVHGKTSDDIFDYVMRKYKGGGRYGPMVKVCKKLDKALLYVRYMFDDAVLNGLLTGRQDLAEQMKKTLGIETLENYFFEPRQNAKRDRLAEYCRQDAYVCANLMGLFHPEGGRSILCDLAMITVGVPSSSSAHSQLVKKCVSDDGPPFACVLYSKEEPAHRLCENSVHSALDLQEP